MNYITKVIQIAGLNPTAKAVGVSYQAVRKWEANGCLPRTEFTGETNYAAKLANLVQHEVSEKQLMSMRPVRKCGS